MIYELNYPASKLLQFAVNHIFVLDDKITWCFVFFPLLRRIKDAFTAALFNWTLWCGSQEWTLVALNAQWMKYMQEMDSYTGQLKPTEE